MPDGRVPEKAPSFIDDKDFECGGFVRVANRGVGAVQNVEEERLQNLRVFVHAFEVEGLKRCEREMVFRVVKNGLKRSALNPLLELNAKAALEHIGQG